MQCHTKVEDNHQRHYRLTAESVRMVVVGDLMFFRSQTLTVRSSLPDTRLSPPANTAVVTCLQNAKQSIFADLENQADIDTFSHNCFSALFTGSWMVNWLLNPRSKLVLDRSTHLRRVFFVSLWPVPPLGRTVVSWSWDPWRRMVSLYLRTLSLSHSSLTWRLFFLATSELGVSLTSFPEEALYKCDPPYQK